MHKTHDSGALDVTFLSQEDVIALGGLDMELAIDDVAEALRLHAIGDAVVPYKGVLRWGDADSEAITGRINSMPGYVGGRFAMAGIKWISSVPSNIGLGLPRAAAVTILNDPTLGYPVAILDGTLISAMRTGAVSGVAARFLARHGSADVVVYGAGVQSRTQLMAIVAACQTVQKVSVVDIDPSRAATWIQDMSARMPSVSFEVAVDREAATRSADIIVTATTSEQPFFSTGLTKPGVLYCQIGSHEAEGDAIKEFDRIVVDDWSQMKHRGVQSLVHAVSDGYISEDDIAAELGYIVAAQQQGRSSDTERIYFSAVGMGIEDVAIATRIWRRAVTERVGKTLSLWHSPVFR